MPRCLSYRYPRTLPDHCEIEHIDAVSATVLANWDWLLWYFILFYFMFCKDTSGIYLTRYVLALDLECT